MKTKDFNFRKSCKSGGNQSQRIVLESKWKVASGDVAFLRSSLPACAPLALSLIALSVGVAVGQVYLATSFACGINNLHSTGQPVEEKVGSCCSFPVSQLHGKGDCIVKLIEGGLLTTRNHLSPEIEFQGAVALLFFCYMFYDTCRYFFKSKDKAHLFYQESTWCTQRDKFPHASNGHSEGLDQMLTERTDFALQHGCTVSRIWVLRLFVYLHLEYNSYK